MKSTRDIIAGTAQKPEDLFNYLMLNVGDVQLRHHKQSFLVKLSHRYGGVSLLNQTLTYAAKELADARKHPKIVVKYVPWGGHKIREREPNDKIEPLTWMTEAIRKAIYPANLKMREMEQKILESLPSPSLSDGESPAVEVEPLLLIQSPPANARGPGKILLEPPAPPRAVRGIPRIG